VRGDTSGAQGNVAFVQLPRSGNHILEPNVPLRRHDPSGHIGTVHSFSFKTDFLAKFEIIEEIKALMILKMSLKTTLLALFIASVSARTTVHFSPTQLSLAAESPLKIAFGSCFHIFNMKNDIFATIGENRPNLWVWLGDAAYTDNVRKAGCKHSTYY
jgi:hypothetical protein